MSTPHMSTRDSSKRPSFEQAIARLEEILTILDKPETGLEETIALAAEGNELLRSSRKLLEEAELKIRTLSTPAAAEPTDPAPPSAASPSATTSTRTTSEPKTAPAIPDDHGFSLF